MPHPADMVLDANYEGPFAADAEYFAPGVTVSAGTGLACRVMRGGQQAGLELGGLVSRPQIDTDLLRVRASQVARPHAGGHFMLRDEAGEPIGTYRIQGEPDRLDSHRREWSCETVRTDKPGGD